jgi:hypothetical protein
MADRLLPRNNRMCTVDGCGDPARGRGYCNLHYRRWRRHGDPLGGNASPIKPPINRAQGAPCSVSGCGRPILAQGLCKPHYTRQQKDGDLKADIPIKDLVWRKPESGGNPCKIEGCTRPCRAQGYCSPHYERLRKYGDPLGGGPMRLAWVEQIKGPCTVDGCEKITQCRGLCASHYQRWRNHGDPLHGGPVLRRQNIAGRRVDPILGYAMWTDATHPQAMKNGQVLEHRALMAEIIGRPLLTKEQVHHRNGRRDDNRPGNLEIWTSCQPSGQEPLDLIAYAREILAMYPPEIEAKLIEMKQLSEADPEFARPSALTCEAEE